MLRTKASLRELVRFTPCQFSSHVLNMDIIPDPERQITLAAHSEIFLCGYFSHGKLLLEVNLSARSSNFIMTADCFLFHTHQVGNSELAS